MTILITGGCGYIGSHVCLELAQLNFDIVVIDSLENSTTGSLKAINKHTNKIIPFYKGKIHDKIVLQNIFANHNIECVIHMAGYKSVKESVLYPEKYYYNNIEGTEILLDIMKKNNCYNLIFSSSATVYGNANGVCTENSPVGALNPYGETKLKIEQLLDTLDSNWSIISLRYFNPVGAHKSYIIGEDPKGVPENLVPYIIKVIKKELPTLVVFGNDYSTPDGTPIRDYIHVVDVAKAHVKAYEYLINNKVTHERFNLGTGKGYSVLEIISTFDSLGQKVPYQIGERRNGDSECIYADSSKAYEILNWKAVYGIYDMCKDALKWNPN